MAGLPVDKKDVQTAAGTIANRLRVVVNDANNLGTWLAAKTVSDLTTMGISSADANLLKSVYPTEFLSVKSAFNSMVSMPQLWGLGV